MRKSMVDDAPQDAENEINLTPMLDVVFIMLIFFIVTASFIKETGIDVSRPDAPPAVIPSDSNILITIGKKSGIWMGRRLIDPRAVRANIERMHAENPDASVVIQPDRRSFNDTLVQVMDASREAGVYDISIAADSSDLAEENFTLARSVQWINDDGLLQTGSEYIEELIQERLDMMQRQSP